jgi:hypothetical protein
VRRYDTWHVPGSILDPDASSGRQTEDWYLDDIYLQQLFDIVIPLRKTNSGHSRLLVADAAVVASVFHDLNHVRHPFKLYLRPRSVHASVYPHVPFKELDAIQLRGSFYRSRTPTLLLQDENR